MAVADDTDDEDEGYARPREYYGSVSGSYRVASTDTGLITLVAAVAKHTHFVQRVHTEVTTGAASELWGVQDGATTPVPIVGSLSAAAIAHADRDFGANGVPCTEGTALTLNVSGATGAIGSVTWEGYKKLTRAAVVTPPLIRYAELVIADGASNYWRLNEAFGTTAVDSIGGANGTISGGVTLNQPGALSDGDKAMLFDAANDYISVPVGSYSAIGTGSFSIELWVNSVQTFLNAPFIIDNGGGANGTGFAVFRTASNRIGLKIANGTTNAITTSVCTFDGRWHHVVAVLRRGTPDLVEVFVDGISGGTGSPAADGWNLTSTRALLFSTYSGGEADADFRYNGYLDDVAIYPVALSAAQITAHYQAGITLPRPI